ncbi:hypothetical protein BHE74_00027376 [Ensete ventricosum]|nr:hypothetical protein BHE74_00027376 [Ensete ventricosum]
MAVASASVASSTAAAILYCVSPSPVSSGANRILLEKRPSSLSWSSSIPLVPISSQQLRKPPSSITPSRQVSIAKILIKQNVQIKLKQDLEKKQFRHLEKQRELRLAIQVMF